MNLDEVNVKLDEILEKINGTDIGIDLPFSSSFVLGAANFATSYVHVYSELKVPVGTLSNTFTIKCTGNLNDKLGILTITGSDNQSKQLSLTTSEQTITLDISKSIYVTLLFDKPSVSNTNTYLCSGEYTIS